MFDEFEEVMNRVTQDLDKKYVGLGRDASNQNMHPEIRKFLKKHSLRPDVVDAILNLAQDLIDSRETVRIGHRTGSQGQWSDYNPYLISDITLFGFQFSPKSPAKRKNRKTGETKVQYPAMKVMAYKNEVVESNIIAMSQAGLLKDYGNDPQKFAKALTEHSKTAFRKYGPEAKINPELGKGTRWNVVNYETASRNGEPFEDGIKKLGLPNLNNNWCTRELKLRPIKYFIEKHLKWKNYWTAIGIRSDEIDRVSSSRLKEKLYYPLVQDQPMNKPKINFWWSQQKFRLNLKGYEGNCKWCWKKSDNKLMTIAVEKPEYFDFPKKMEHLYSDFVPESKKHSMTKPVKMFRKYKSTEDIFKNSKLKFTRPKDDSDIYNYQISIFDKDIDTSNGCDESCEIY